MSWMRKRKLSLRTLGRKVPLGALPQVQLTFLLQMLIDLSQVLNGGAAQTEALARALILDGRQRLRRLRKAAPHLDLSLAHALERIRTNKATDGHLSDEDNAAQAMLEMYLGLILQWLSETDDLSYISTSSLGIYHRSWFGSSLFSHFPRFNLLFRARSCLIA